MNILAGTGISAGMDFATQLMAQQHQKKMAKKDRNYGREMAEYAYNKELEMWNRANEYNTPSEQMQRLKDAGLNPHLAYGKGSVANTSAAQLPKYSVPTSNFRDVQPLRGVDVIGKYYSLLGASNKNRIDQNAIETADLTQTGLRQTQLIRENKPDFIAAEKIAASPTLRAQLGSENIRFQRDSMRIQNAEMKAKVAAATLAELKAKNALTIGTSQTPTPEAMMMVAEMRNANLTDSEIRRALIAYGITGKVLDNLIGVIPFGKFTGSKVGGPKRKPGVSVPSQYRKNPSYNSAEAWRRLQRRID